MFVVEVMPITRSYAPGTLTYFSPEKVAGGTLVSITLRKRIVPGVVLQCTEAHERKTELRQAGFTLQKLRGKGKAVFAASFLDAVGAIAHYFVAAPGAVFSALAPLPLLRQVKELPEAKPETSGRGYEQLVLQAPYDERLSEYRSLIREAFARRESILLVVPTIAEALALEEELSRGVTEYVVVLHSELKSKEALARFTRASEDPHPLLIIVTPGFLAVPRADLSLIIVEREGARAYKRLERPFIDIRIAAREVARARRIRILLGDLPLRIETLRAFEQHDAAEITPVRSRIVFRTPASTIDMREYRKGKKGFQVLSNELSAALKEVVAEGRHAFLYVTRRGLQPSTVCDDCGNPVRCDSCDRMVVLHKTPSGNVFLCHTCGTRRSAHEKCRTCNSWKLTSLGIGSAGVEEALHDLLPKTPLFRIDQDATRDHGKAAKVANAFYESPSGILVGTERAIPYLRRPLELIAVASLDSLFALPDYAADERIFSLIARLRTLAAGKLLIQTREPSRSVFTHALSGALMDFYREEIAARERFSYPPFSTLVRVSVSGGKPQVEKAAGILEEKLKRWEPALFPGMLRTKRGVSAHLLLKVRKWPEEELERELRSLPPSVVVEVGAGSVLPKVFSNSKMTPKS